MAETPYSGVRHAITVKRLRELLNELRDDDILIPNAVGNLKIDRNGAYVGFVDLLHTSPHVELFGADE